MTTARRKLQSEHDADDTSYYAATTSPHAIDVQVVEATSSVYPLPVDAAQFDRATAIKPWSLLRPHMRIFHLAWMSGIPGFCGWYAIPPLMPVIKTQLQLTNSQVLNSDIACTASTILTRILVGPVLDSYGPQLVQSMILLLGAIPVACAAFVNSSTALIIVRFFIGFIGCIFVSCQYWTTITFAKNVVGTSNAITGGFGLAGIGFAFLLLPYVYELIISSVSPDLGWRITIALPALWMILMSLVIRVSVDSCPMGKFENMKAAKIKAAGDHAAVSTGLIASLRIAIWDWNTVILMLHYGICFGAELQLNNMGALYFYEEFTTCDANNQCTQVLSKTQAATIASFFGLMNLFARAVGGITSDVVNRRFGITGRKVAQFAMLLLEGVLLILLSQTRQLGGCIALYVLVAMAAQAAGGSTFGIVPYVNESFTGTVTGLVGAGGNVGGVIFGLIFKATSSRQPGLLYMGIIVIIGSLCTFGLRLRTHSTKEEEEDIASFSSKAHENEALADSTLQSA